MSSVSIHPPKTPVTTGSNGIAKATIPNVCKMPGPPAPFIPSPLPNIAKSGMSPEGYSKTVKIEGNAVAIRGATFESIGDMASKGTGGGLLSANTHGPAKFITPGSVSVKIESKSVHLLGESMLNNCGASGKPPNTGATMTGVDQADLSLDQLVKLLCQLMCECRPEAKAGKFEVPTDPSALDSHDPGDYSAEDFGIEEDGKRRAARYQKCVERKLKEDYKDSNLIAEQPYNMSTNPPTPGRGPKNMTRIPDIVRLRGHGPPIQGNVDVIEMKFWDDESSYKDKYSDKHKEQDSRINGGKDSTEISKDTWDDVCGFKCGE